MKLKRVVSGASEKALRSTVESLKADEAYETRTRSFICGPIAKLSKIIKYKCAISYETNKVDSPDELILTEPDVELLIDALDQWIDNNNHQTGIDAILIRRYLVDIKSQMVKIRKGLF